MVISLEPLGELPQNDDTIMGMDGIWERWREISKLKSQQCEYSSMKSVMSKEKEFMYIRIDFGPLACKHKVSRIWRTVILSRKINVL